MSKKSNYSGLVLSGVGATALVGMAYLAIDAWNDFNSIFEPEPKSKKLLEKEKAGYQGYIDNLPAYSKEVCKIFNENFLGLATKDAYKSHIGGDWSGPAVYFRFKDDSVTIAEAEKMKGFLAEVFTKNGIEPTKESTVQTWEEVPYAMRDRDYSISAKERTPAIGMYFGAWRGLTPEEQAEKEAANPGYSYARYRTFDSDFKEKAVEFINTKISRINEDRTRTPVLDCSQIPAAPK